MVVRSDDDIIPIFNTWYPAMNQGVVLVKRERAQRSIGRLTGTNQITTGYGVYISNNQQFVENMQNAYTLNLQARKDLSKGNLNDNDESNNPFDAIIEEYFEYDNRAAADKKYESIKANLKGLSDLREQISGPIGGGQDPITPDLTDDVKSKVFVYRTKTGSEYRMYFTTEGDSKIWVIEGFEGQLFDSRGEAEQFLEEYTQSQLKEDERYEEQVEEQKKTVEEGKEQKNLGMSWRAYYESYYENSNGNPSIENGAFSYMVTNNLSNFDSTGNILTIKTNRFSNDYLHLIMGDSWGAKFKISILVDYGGLTLKKDTIIWAKSSVLLREGDSMEFDFSDTQKGVALASIVKDGSQVFAPKIFDDLDTEGITQDAITITIELQTITRKEGAEKQEYEDIKDEEESQKEDQNQKKGGDRDNGDENGKKEDEKKEEKEEKEEKDETQKGAPWLGLIFITISIFFVWWAIKKSGSMTGSSEGTE